MVMMTAVVVMVVLGVLGAMSVTQLINEIYSDTCAQIYNSPKRRDRWHLTEDRKL